MPLPTAKPVDGNSKRAYAASTTYLMVNSLPAPLSTCFQTPTSPSVLTKEATTPWP